MIINRLIRWQYGIAHGANTQKYGIITIHVMLILLMIGRMLYRTLACPTKDQLILMGTLKAGLADLVLNGARGPQGSAASTPYAHNVVMGDG